MGLGDQKSPRRTRVLLAKVGLDGHDRGVRVVAKLLAAHGHEVIYLGRRQTATSLVNAAMDEDVDVVGISILSGTHDAIIDQVLGAAREQGASFELVVGGTILRAEISSLKERGVSAVFPVGTSLDEITNWFGSVAERRRSG